MSRTKRKDSITDEYTLVGWINYCGHELMRVDRCYIGDVVYRYFRFSTAEEIAFERDETASEYRKFTRDGKMSKSGQNKGFKHEAKKHVRNSNKKFCNAVLRDEDWENIALPTHKEGKQFVWNWF